MKRTEVVSMLNDLGFAYSHTKGSHMIFKHPDGARPVGLCHNSKNKEFGPAAVKILLREASQSIELGRQLKAKRA